MHRSFPGLAAAVAAVSVSVAAFPACGIHGPYKAEARDTWSHTYSLSKNGEVSIGNVNGRVDIEGTDGSTVEVQAEKIARAATEQLANELLPKIPINDHSAPDFVRIETGRMDGFLIGASFEVRYHVKVPKGATVSGSTVNGTVEVRGLSGRVNAHTTNGAVIAKDITGGLEARTVNGGVSAQFDAVGSNDIILGVVNGGIRISVPDTAKITLKATWVNGGVRTNGLNFDVRDTGKRHYEGRLNGGGTQITATTVNGGISIGTGKNGDENSGDFISDIVNSAVKDAVKDADKTKVDHVAP